MDTFNQGIGGDCSSVGENCRIIARLYQEPKPGTAGTEQALNDVVFKTLWVGWWGFQLWSSVRSVR